VADPYSSVSRLSPEIHRCYFGDAAEAVADVRLGGNTAVPCARETDREPGAWEPVGRQATSSGRPFQIERTGVNPPPDGRVAEYVVRWIVDGMVHQAARQIRATPSGSHEYFFKNESVAGRFEEALFDSGVDLSTVRVDVVQTS